MKNQNKPIGVLALLDEEQVTEAYESVEKMLYTICHSFARQYNWSFDELVSEARFQFMRAYRSFNPGKGAKLSTWVHFVVSRKLITYIGKEIERVNNELPFPEDLEPGSSPANSIMGMLEFLTADAREVLTLITELPAPFASRLRMDNRTSDRGVRKTLVGYLKDSGWEWERIDETMDELAGAVA